MMNISWSFRRAHETSLVIACQKAEGHLLQAPYIASVPLRPFHALRLRLYSAQCCRDCASNDVTFQTPQFHKRIHGNDSMTDLVWFWIVLNFILHLESNERNREIEKTSQEESNVAATHCLLGQLAPGEACTLGIRALHLSCCGNEQLWICNDLYGSASVSVSICSLCHVREEVRNALAERRR